MWTFDASLRTLGDRKGLPATLTIEDGRLAIDAGDQPIGDWSLSEIQLEPTPTGYRMAAEGEQILLDIENVDDFTLALNGKKVKGRKKDAPSPKVSTKVKHDRKTAEPEPAPARAERVGGVEPAVTDASRADGGPDPLATTWGFLCDTGRRRGFGPWSVHMKVAS